MAIDENYENLSNKIRKSRFSATLIVCCPLKKSCFQLVGCYKTSHIFHINTIRNSIMLETKT